MTTNDIYVRSEHIVGRRLADEYILVPIVSRGADVDSIFNLNRVGAFIWELLDGRTPQGAVVEALVERFEVKPDRASRDCAEFLAQLESVQAVRRVAWEP